MSVLLLLVGVLVVVLLLGELSARLWRRTHPAPDRFARFRQWRTFCGLWMVVAAATIAVLVGTHVLPVTR